MMFSHSEHVYSQSLSREFDQPGTSKELLYGLHWVRKRLHLLLVHKEYYHFDAQIY